MCRLQRLDRGESGRERGSWQRASVERETGNEASQAPGPPQPFRPSPITPSSTTVRCSHTHTHKRNPFRAPFYSPFSFLAIFVPRSLFFVKRLSYVLPLTFVCLFSLIRSPFVLRSSVTSQIHKRLPVLHSPPPNPPSISFLCH